MRHYAAAASQWRIVEIELLATVGFEAGLPAFQLPRVVVSKICYVQYRHCVQDLDYRTLIVLSVVLSDCCKSKNSCRDWAFSNTWLEVGLPVFQLPSSQNVTHCRKKNCSTCLFKTSIPAVPFRNSKHAVSTKSRFLRAQYPPPVLQYGCIMNHARPFVATSEKSQSHAEKQRVWSRSCGLQELLRTIQGLCPRFGLQDIDCALSCAIRLLQIKERLSRLSF